MSSQELYNTTLTSLNNRNPKMAAYFQNIIQLFSQHIKIDETAVRCAEKLAYASRYVFINQHIIVYAIRRNEIQLFSEVLSHLTVADYWHGEAFLSSYPKLTCPLSFVSDSLVRLSGKSLSNIRNSGRVISYCLCAESSEHILFLINVFNTVAHFAPGFVVDFYDVVKEKLAKYPWDTIQKWMIRGIDLFTSNRKEEAVDFLKLQSKESRRFLNIFHTTLSDMKNILNIYCSSLAGRAMNILSSELSGFAIKATYTDGKSIFLPPVINFFNKTELNENVYTALAAHQAATIKLNTYGFDFTAIGFMTELRRRYGTLLPNIMANVKRQYGAKATSIKEMASGEIAVTFPSKRRLLILETDHEKFFYSFPAPDFARDLFNIIENARIEHHLSQLYNGLKNDFEVLNSYLFKTRPEVRSVKGDREEEFFIILECFIQYSLVKKWKYKNEDMRTQELLHDIISEFNTIFDVNNTVEDSAEICFNIFNLFFENFQIVSICSKNDVHGSFSELNKPEINPEVILESSPELLRTGSGPANYDPVGDTKDQAIDLTSATSRDKRADDIRKALVSGSARIFQYPEFDFAMSSYLPKHCTLFETKLKSQTGDFYELILKKRQRLHKRIKKKFLYLQPEEIEMSRHWFDGDEIHLGDAVDFTIDVLRGAEADEKIYYQKVRNVRDIAVAILLDASSSTDEVVNQQKIIHTEKEALSLLASVLSSIGDTFGIFTFFSTGRQKVLFNILKDFDEPWNSTSQGRISSVKAYAGNRDGCAIRHTLTRIDELPNKTKLIIMLSDGIPADVGYGSESSADTNQYAIEDTQHAVAECRFRGVVPYCITIDKKARSYIPHLYGTYNYTIIDDVALLPERLSKLYLRLTR
ncbi:MAG: VWA domain-containing protein [Spirochaetes bacterium]|nr:VWA domain-containing protein [Spirochaetota bacterium]